MKKAKKRKARKYCKPKFDKHSLKEFLEYAKIFFPKATDVLYSQKRGKVIIYQAPYNKLLEIDANNVPFFKNIVTDACFKYKAYRMYQN